MYDSSFPPPVVPQPSPEKPKHSKLGIVSFVLGLVALLLFCIAFVMSFGYGISLASNNPYYNPSMIDQSSPIVLIASGLFMCGPGLGLVGIGLGIASVIQKADRKIFGIIGLAINGLIILSICVLFFIGLAVRSGY